MDGAIDGFSVTFGESRKGGQVTCDMSKARVMRRRFYSIPPMSVGDTAEHVCDEGRLGYELGYGPIISCVALYSNP